MTKREVSKLTYISWNVIYHALCASGLIWQVVQISVNFFQFDVIKDINVIMPDEIKDQDRVLYICFKSFETLSRERYVERFFEKAKNREIPRKLIPGRDSMDSKQFLTLMLTIQERFQLCNKRIFRNIRGTEFFIIGARTCLQVKGLSMDNYQVLQSELQNVTRIYLSLGKKLPYFDPRRSISIRNLKNLTKGNMTIEFDIMSSAFMIEKLKKPYKDECVDYAQQNYVDKIDAIADCMDVKLRKNYNGTYVSKNRLITKSNHKFYKYSIGYNNTNECESQLNHSDCIHHYYLTEVKPPKYYDTYNPHIVLSVDEDTSASFTIVSKPRIDNIDYVTYILGALGSWIGFSFIGINPIPFLLTMKSNAIHTTENHRTDEKLDKVSKDNAILKCQITFLKYRNFAMKHLIMQHDNRLKSLEENTNVNE